MIDGGNGSGLFIGGSAKATLVARTFYEGNTSITAGSGRSTLVGSTWGTSVLTAKGSSADVLIAGEYGQDTLSGGASTGRDLLEGFLGPYTPNPDSRPIPTLTLIEAGQGNDTLVAGAGSTTMVGGAGHDVFRFINDVSNQQAGGNTTVLNGFVQGRDHIDLRGYADTTPAILAAAGHASGGTVLHLQDGTTVTVSNVTLTAGDLSRHA